MQGAWRFVQRLWRLVGEAAEIAQRRAGRARPTFGDAGARARARRRIGALAKVSDDDREAAFQRCVAQIYEFANALGLALGDLRSNGDRRPDYRLGDARGRRHPGAAVPPDDAASGRGMLGRARPQDPGGRAALAAARARTCWSRTPSPCRSRSTARRRADVTVRATPKSRYRGCRSGPRCGKTGARGQAAQKGHRRPAKDRECGGLKQGCPSARAAARAGVLAAGLTAGCFQPLYGRSFARPAGRRSRDGSARVEVLPVEAPNGTPEARLGVEIAQRADVRSDRRRLGHAADPPAGKSQLSADAPAGDRRHHHARGRTSKITASTRPTR